MSKTKSAIIFHFSRHSWTRLFAGALVEGFGHGGGDGEQVSPIDLCFVSKCGVLHAFSVALLGGFTDVLGRSASGRRQHDRTKRLHP